MSERPPPGARAGPAGLWRRHKDARQARLEPSTLSKQLDELGARLLVHDPSTQPVRNLYALHQALSTDGWIAAEALAASVIERACVEAEILHSQDPSAVMRSVCEQLESIRAARGERSRADADTGAFDDRFFDESPAVPEVSEASHEEYELMERSWIGTVPQEYHPSEPAPLILTPISISTT